MGVGVEEGRGEGGDGTAENENRPDENKSGNAGNAPLRNRDIQAFRTVPDIHPCLCRSTLDRLDTARYQAERERARFPFTCNNIKFIYRVVYEYRLTNCVVRDELRVQRSTANEKADLVI